MNDNQTISTHEGALLDIAPAPGDWLGTADLDLLMNGYLESWNPAKLSGTRPNSRFQIL
jgi:hypothetical protein